MSALQDLAQEVNETRSPLNYRTFFPALKKALRPFNSLIKRNGPTIRVSFTSPITGNPVIIFFDSPHGSQLTKTWPGWRHSIRSGLERARL